MTRCASSEESRIFLPAWRALHNWESNGNMSLLGVKTVFPEGIYPYIMPSDNRVSTVYIEEIPRVWNSVSDVLRVGNVVYCSI